MPPRLRLQLFHLALQRQRLALAHLLERAVLRHRLQVLQALDRRLDRLEVGEHAAQPAVVDVGHAGALRLLGDDLARLALGADEQDGAAVHGQLADVLHRLLVHRHRLFEVDDVNLVALAEDVIRHLRVPVAGLVAEVHPGFQHLTHGDRHHYTPWSGLGLDPPPGPGCRLEGGARSTLNGRICEFAWFWPGLADKRAESPLQYCSEPRQTKLTFDFSTVFVSAGQGLTLSAPLPPP